MIANKAKILITLGILAIAQNTRAADIAWTGFLNATGAVSNSATPYLGSEINERGNFNEAIFGINMAADLGDDLQLAAQLEGVYGDILLDWAFVSFRLNEATSVAAGKLKYPGNLVSEYVDTGYLYPWIRPPQEIYGHDALGGVMSLEAFNGARILYSGFKDNVEYDVQLYIGAITEEAMSHDRMFGLSFMLSTAASQLVLSFNRANMLMTDIPTAPMNDKNMTILSVAGTTEWRNFVAYAEYASSGTQDVPLLDTTAWYTTLGYRFGKTTPHITYSSMVQDTGIGQSSWTLGLRRELTLSAALKLEWQRIKPDAITAAGIAAVPMLVGRAGLFGSTPAESEIDMLSVSVNVFF